MSRHIPRLVLQVTVNQSVINHARFYSRWAHRNPGKVILPFEPTGKIGLRKEKIIDLDPGIYKKSEEKVLQIKTNNDDLSNSDVEQPSRSLPKEKTKEIKSKREEKLTKRKFYLSQKKVFDDNGEVIYEKLNENDGRIGYLQLF